MTLGNYVSARYALRRGPDEDSRFVPPPPREPLSRGMDDWEKWVNSEIDIPLLVKAALGHYQFETLHPFSDGNGRLGRLVIIFQIMCGASGTPF